MLLDRCDLFLTQSKKVLVSLQLKLTLTRCLLFVFELFLEQFLLVLQLVLDTLDVQFQLLFDLDMVPDLSLVLLQHRFVLAWSFVTTHDTLALFGLARSSLIDTACHFIITTCVGSLLLSTILVFLALAQLHLLLHLHVHENLNACFDVLQDREGGSFTQTVPLLRQYLLIVRIYLLSEVAKQAKGVRDESA